MNLKTSLFLTLVFLTSYAFAQNFQKSSLLKDVRSLPMPDTGKFVSAFYTTNEEPDIVATHRLAPQVEVSTTIMMTSNLGRGKIFAIGSSEYFESKLLSDQNVQKLLKNILENAGTQPKKLKVAVTKFADPALISFLKANKARVYIAENAKFQPNTSLYFLTEDVKDTTAQQKIEKYIRDGGQLIYGSPYPGIFKHRDHTKSYINDLVKINSLLSKAGIF